MLDLGTHFSSFSISSGERQKGFFAAHDVPLRTRRALYKVYDNSALLVLNRTSLICVNTLLALT